MIATARWFAMVTVAGGRKQLSKDLFKSDDASQLFDTYPQ
jgi:hypothetical protein